MSANHYINEVKKRLKKYRDLQAQHRVLINRYLTAGDPYKNISTDYSRIPSGSKTHYASSKIENAIIKSDEQITMNSTAAKELQELDLAIEPLSTLQKDIITMKYIDNKAWIAIIDQIGYSESLCKREGKLALKRMADILYGEASYTDLPIYEYIKSTG